MTGEQVIRELVLTSRPADPSDFMVAIAFGWTPQARVPNQDFILAMWIWASQVVYRQERDSAISRKWIDVGGEA